MLKHKRVTSRVPVSYHQPQPHIASLNPYIPGLPIEEVARTYQLDPEYIIKLASNENPLGMSKLAVQAAEQALLKGQFYPDGHNLTHALAEFYDVKPENIVLGNGSNDVLDLIARVFLGKGTEAISSQYGFIVYRLVTQMTGAKNVITRAADYGHDLKAMQAAITPYTRVIWIANPNNPTGTFIPYAALKAFIDKIPEEIIIVLDEAYYEYLPEAQKANSISWLTTYPNLILTRTFSKAYGLAGLRVGYAIASPPVAGLLNRVRQPFNVNSVGLAAAVAALQDQAFVDKTVALNTKSLSQLKKGLNSLGIPYLPTFGNFITVAHPRAASVCQDLLEQGIIVRKLLEYDMPDHLRVSTGLEEDNEYLLRALNRAPEN